MFANAEAYERFMGRWSSLVAPKLVDLSKLPSQGRVLDVGSGTGSLAFAIAERHRQLSVVGIDPSKEYIAYAGSKNRFGDRVQFEAGDAQKLRFENSSFDGAASLLVFNFIPDPRKALGELQRVVKPGGTVAAAVWDYGDGMRMLRIFWDAVVSLDPNADKTDEKHMHLCRSGELTELWRGAGLREVVEQPIEITMQFRSFADYWDPFLLRQGPAGAYAGRLSPEKTNALKNEVQRRLGVRDESRPFDLGGKVWAVRGQA